MSLFRQLTIHVNEEIMDVRKIKIHLKSIKNRITIELTRHKINGTKEIVDWKILEFRWKFRVNITRVKLPVHIWERVRQVECSRGTKAVAVDCCQVPYRNMAKIQSHLLRINKTQSALKLNFQRYTRKDTIHRMFILIKIGRDSSQSHLMRRH